MGNHLLDNDEVYTVLCFMARPKSELEMKKWLGQSVWDAKTYHKSATYKLSFLDFLGAVVSIQLHYSPFTRWI